MFVDGHSGPTIAQHAYTQRDPAGEGRGSGDLEQALDLDGEVER